MTGEDEPRLRDDAVRGESDRRPFGLDRDGVVFTVPREAHRIVLRQHHLSDEGEFFQIAVAPLSVVTAFEIALAKIGRATELESMKLFGEIIRRLVRSGRSGAAPFEFVRGQVADVFFERLDVRRGRRRMLRERGLRQNEKKDEWQESIKSVFHIVWNLTGSVPRAVASGHPKIAIRGGHARYRSRY